MKKAFTLIELIFIIVIIGILSTKAFVIFSGPSKLKAATEQIVRDLQYTKHLAMVDDKFTPFPVGVSVAATKNSKYWFKQNWQLMFRKIDSKQTYVVFSDKATNNAATSEFNSVPSEETDIEKNDELALDPHDHEKFLGKGNKDLEIEEKYGITNVSFEGGCSHGRKISFDYLGRPYNGFNKGSSSPNPYDSLYQITTSCLITLTHQSDGEGYICITPTTGYIYEVDNKGDCK